MKFTENYSDDALLKEIGNRLTQFRLHQNKTQAALAREAGVSIRTLTRIEHGYSVQTLNLIRILRVLQLVENLDALIPEPVVSPVQQLKMQGKQRQRASRKPARPKEKNTWSWGNEQ